MCGLHVLFFNIFLYDLVLSWFFKAMYVMKLKIEGEKRMICPKCGGDTFIMVSDVGLKCENCGYVYSIEGKK